MSDDYRVSTDVITCFIQKGIESFLFRQHQQSLDVARFVPLASNDIFVYTEVPLIDFMHAVTFEPAGMLARFRTDVGGTTSIVSLGRGHTDDYGMVAQPNTCQQPVMQHRQKNKT